MEIYKQVKEKVRVVSNQFTFEHWSKDKPKSGHSDASTSIPDQPEPYQYHTPRPKLPNLTRDINLHQEWRAHNQQVKTNNISHKLKLDLNMNSETKKLYLPRDYDGAEPWVAILAVLSNCASFVKSNFIWCSSINDKSLAYSILEIFCL